MSGPSELSFDEILKFMLKHNGKVTNHELVKHFKIFLTNPDMRDEARNTFKKHVNTLAVIKNHNNEKWLLLKKKYFPNEATNDDQTTESAYTSGTMSPITPELEMPNRLEPIPYRPPPPPPTYQLSEDLNLANYIAQDNQNFSINVDEKENSIPNVDVAPKAFPRKKVIEKSKTFNQINQNTIPETNQMEGSQSMSDLQASLSPTKSEDTIFDSEHKISVKERKQMFNRMASEGDIGKPLHGSPHHLHGADEDDRVSIISVDHKSESGPLDPKQKAWILSAAKGDYHALAKMCSENAKLSKTKDPFTTAMHWACKRGDENIVKLLAGITRKNINERSNGGYTPLHIAMQFRHENVYRLLVEVYDADPNIRDWSGKKAKQYLIHMDTSFSPGSYRRPPSSHHHLYGMQTSSSFHQKKVIRKSSSLNIHSATKKEGFLRIGSLNVRVKKTTEAFSNFLGVSSTRSSAYVPKTARLDEKRDELDHLHKDWGSADNIQDDKMMPPPLSNKVRRRGVSGRKGLSSHSRSTPSTPDQPRASLGPNDEGDSDSDSAAGFHSAWRQQRSSNIL